MAFQSDYPNEDSFEKVGTDEQDEGVSSTSGFLAEEDEYPDEGTTHFSDDYANSLNNYGQDDNFTTRHSDTTPISDSEPLIFFGSSQAQPSAPPIPQTRVTESTPPPIELFEQVSYSTKSQQDKGFSERDEKAPAVPACWMKNVDPRVLDLIYWKDVKKTGVVFGSMLFVLLSLVFFSLLSVLAYLALAILSVTFTFRLYKSVMQAVQKTNEGHPFRKYLEMDLNLKEAVVERAAENIAKNLNNVLGELRRLFLVEDIVDSLKFGLLLYLLTYIGCCFNGMTLVIMAVVAVFTLPKVYDTYKVSREG
ncbi:hypothetical protein CHS0354_024219 [Potamilus streckersoni]|uniref:Reticulon-like protein n=1 Tax=Potamilus streckersoni TaxID=2493646 RepID=A0AAE0SBB3_9BIVA|nr:hypothetical protein CHS0354_024219 [Potamilus streckersoni]